MAGKLEKATHQDATDFEGPVETGDAHAKRKADKKGVGQLEPDTSVAKKDTGTVFPSGKVNEEEIKALFSGVEGLSEDFTLRATTLIEGALSEKVETLKEEIEAAYKVQLDEQVQQIVEDYEDKLDSYLDYVVENYMKENKIAIEEGIKSDIAEQVMESVVSIMEANGVDLPEDKIDIAESLAEEVRETERQLNGVITENIELKNKLEKFELKEALESVASDISAAGKERLVKLAENISYTSVEDYKAKVEILKESITGVATPEKVSSAEALTEEVRVPSDKVEVKNAHSARMEAYLATLRGEV